MRQHYTPVFKKILATRLWATPPSTRCVWMWLSLAADPEGFVPADVAGLTLGANVTPSEAREALAFLEAPDPEADPEDATEGRLVRRVHGGWEVLGHEGNRELAKVEGQKARNRDYMRRMRAQVKARANDVAPPSHPQNAKVDAPKPIPKPKTILPSEGEGSPLPPSPLVARFVDPGSYVVAPPVIHRIPADWEPGPELREEARLAGVKNLDEHYNRLKSGPIGGSRGVFASDLADYVRSMFGKWRTWEETDRAKAANRPEAYPGRQPEPELPKLPHVPGYPKWVLESHKVAADLHGLNLKSEAKAFAKSHHIPPQHLDRLTAAQAFTQYLLRRSTEAA